MSIVTLVLLAPADAAVAVIKLESVSLAILGKVKRVVIDKDTTTIIGGAGDKSAIDGRVGAIRREIEASTSDYDKEKLRERLAKLSGGMTEVEEPAKGPGAREPELAQL